MVARLSFILFFILTIAAAAQSGKGHRGSFGMIGAPEYRNRFFMPSYGPANSVTATPVNYDITKKFRVANNIFAGAFFLRIGQSRIANISSQPYTPYVVANPTKCLNFNPYDGFVYQLSDPVLGSSYNPAFVEQTGGWAGQLCDDLIVANKYTQVAFMDIATGGSSVLDWIPGGKFNVRMHVAISWLKLKGIFPTAIMWQQGTTDAINMMSQTTYQTNLRSVISDYNSLMGIAGAWDIALDTQSMGANWAPVRAAQTLVAGDNGNVLGPDMDTIPFPADNDGTHYNNSGNTLAASLWSTNIQAHF